MTPILVLVFLATAAVVGLAIANMGMRLTQTPSERELDVEPGQAEPTCVAPNAP